MTAVRRLIIPLAIALVACAAPAERPAPSPPSQAAPVCVPVKEPRTVEDLNAVVAGYREVEGFQGADVGAEVTLQDGRRLWVFGDTVRAPNFAGQRFTHNSMLIFGPACATVVIPPDRGAMMPDRPDGVGYWPMSTGVVHRGDHDLVGVAAQRVRTGASALEFTHLGPAFALFEVPRGGMPRLVRMRDMGPDDPDKSHPTWGAATAVAGDWVYVYGTATPGAPKAFGWSLRVARVRIEEIENPAGWSYWDGRAWQRDAGRAAEVIPATGGVSQTLSVFSRDGTWYALSKKDDFLGEDLVVWRAPSPTGPFTPSPPLAKIPSDIEAGRIQYLALAHPDLLPEPGSVVVSVCQNFTDLRRLGDRPYLYRPRFLRVRLP
ncbi:uncharacterized protein DUF4185 [Herbihabitans rhizosphaerae]|uniref:Uncharacterized protein DUF4185 n=1 Tax=Herbihabitans rhizosphaerae TaxID=1872711 RepID=A0A4Q7L1Y7_9PSEU|nr:DUF4185 domain-containing protein [Herbihabitans rhizosphaerae]RZS43185.1 uncharacterized protein DUF4185 [Herbihabitans rhizosphaerae]